MKDPNVRPKRVCSPKYAVMKARKGIKLNRWEIEELSKNAFWSMQYALKVSKGRFPEGEAAIGKDPALAFSYAKDVIKGRFPEGEDAILKDCDRWGTRRFLKRYIIDVAGIRNEEFEEHISKEVSKGNECGVAIEYAKKCIGARWEEIESDILKEDLGWASQYHAALFKGRWPQLEDRIILKKKKDRWEDRYDAWEDYLEITGPSPEIEEKLLRTSKAKIILHYAVKAVKGRLPHKLHQKMMMFSFDPKRQSFAKSYLKYVESCERKAIRYISLLDEDERVALLEKARTN